MSKSLIPTISIIMPAYNAGKYLRACLDSILSQDYTSYEVVILNDGSTDNTLEVAELYAKHDARIQVYSNSTNKGISYTLNKAIGLARGKYICRMDADDVMTPSRLQSQIKFLQDNSDHILVGGQVSLVDAEGNFSAIKNFPLDHNSIYPLLYTAMPVQHGTLMINRGLLPKDFVWYEDGMNTAEEVELLFKLLNYGKFANLNEVMIEYRQHDTSLTHTITKEVFRLTYIGRRKGVELHNYKPSIVAYLICELQRIMVWILPTKLIMPTFYRLRKLIILLSKLSAVQTLKPKEINYA